MIKAFSKRFQELNDQLGPQMMLSIGISSLAQQNDGNAISDDFLLNWSIKAKNLISRSCGEDSQHFKAFEKAEKYINQESTFRVLRRLIAIFTAAKEDYEGGHVSSIKSLVQAEVFDSELEQASELANAGYISAAAVIAGTVLETTLRGRCDRYQISHGKLDKMNADLAKAGAHNALSQKRITALAAIRNSAAHGKSEDFTKADVESMIEDVKRYIEKHL